MKLKISLILSCLLLLVSSCSKDEGALPAGDYLIFGHYFKNCYSEQCIEIFKLQGSDLYEDTEDEYPLFESPNTCVFKKTSHSKWEKVKDLPDLIPEYLYKAKKKTFGKPDEPKNGGIYIEYKSGNVDGLWFLDQNEENLPKELKSFVQVIKMRIAMISD